MVKCDNQCPCPVPGNWCFLLTSNHYESCFDNERKLGDFFMSVYTKCDQLYKLILPGYRLINSAILKSISKMFF